ncbi:STE20 serine:threonine protein kinase [Echinococcus multilocularis]|uniref:STE20 serine:threonine protein kinase n=1 Tax=Echinococcus multilocularis TaxID=6211 RepID=A0A068Y0R9_ECHMU|nr:STE20 serine:threonine protein kinase [Echinococcus multilocularis]
MFPFGDISWLMKMSFFGNLLKKLRQGEERLKPKALPSVVVVGSDPSNSWKNIAELGDGAFGKVYKASNIKTGQVAALKSVDFSSDEEMEDLMVEIDILHECKHPNILQLHEAYVFEKKIWMYLEFCGGGAVDSIMKALDKPLTEPQIRFISHEVISGLAFLHKHLIIHRDLKAGNILITLNNEIRLADFGVSTRMASENQKRTTFIGTPYWMAPEVIACETFKDNPYDMAADVWSFGITLIEFAEMLPPYNDLNPTRVLLKITRSDPPTFSRPEAWSPSLNNLLQRCLQKNPGQRPSMDDLKSDPFVANVTEADRSVIKILLGEVNAEVEVTVEDIMPDDLPELDVDMVSYEAAEVMVQSLHAMDDMEEKLSSNEELLNMMSYEDVEFNAEDARIPAPLFDTTSFIPTEENLPIDEKAVRIVADSLVRDLLLGDVDFTSIAFIAFECIKDCQEQSENSKLMQTSFGSKAAPSMGSFSDLESSSPIRLPDFAMEVSQGEDEESRSTPIYDSPMETQERPLVSSEGSATKSGQSSVLRRDGDKERQLSAARKSSLPIASMLQKCPNQFRASIRTRRFVVDGKEHTTTKRVILAEATVRPVEKSVARMRALRDFRELAKESKRRNREIAERVEQQTRQLESKQAAEFTQLHRSLTKELEAAAKKYKASRERLDAEFESDVKALREASIQSEKTFLEQFKQKLEHNVASRTLRKAVFRDVRDTFGSGITVLRTPSDIPPAVEQHYAEAANFFRHREAELNSQVTQLTEVYHKKLGHLDLQLYSEQYELNMGFTKKQGMMEQRHMHMRHQLARSQLKDFALADRQLLAKRLASQLVELREAAEADKTQLQESQMLEKKIFLKNERVARKKRMSMYQRKLREDGPPDGMSVKEALAKVEETERMRASDALLRLSKHHQMQTQALDRELMSRFVELDEQQSEKKTLLVNQESRRLKELDDEHKQEMKAHAERLQRKLLQLREKYEEEVIERADVTSLSRHPDTLPRPGSGSRDNHSLFGKSPSATSSSGSLGSLTALSKTSMNPYRC